MNTTIRFVAYYRVSTKRQGRSGLGLEAQRLDVARLVAERHGCVIASYTEIETGKKSSRPELAKAIAHANSCNATLIVAKLDRLARNVAFTSALMESRVKFVCCDCPDADELHIHILAMIAQHEAKLISLRTKAALAVVKARGKKLGSAREGEWVWKDGQRVWREGAWVGKEHLRGFKQASERAAEVRRQDTDALYAHLVPILMEKRARGQTMEEIAAWLNTNGHCTRSGKPYTVPSVWRLCKRHAPTCLGHVKFGGFLRKALVVA